MNNGKCPKCDSVISSCIVEDVSLVAGETPRWRAFSYSCPSCKTVLGVQMNPLTLNVDLAHLLLKGKQQAGQVEEPKQD